MTMTTQSNLIQWRLPDGFDPDAICRQLDDTGYVVIEGVLTPSEADAVRDVLRAIAATEETEAHRKAKHQRVAKLLRKHPVFIDLMMHPLVLAVWRAYCGRDMVCSTWTANIIQPGHDATHWHVDYPFWSIQPPYPAGRLAGQTLWMLDDFTPENGATGTVPGAHRRGVPPSDPQAHQDGEVVVNATRGSLVLADGCWWHTSRPNRTALARHALLGMYMRKFFITQEDMRSQVEALPDASPELRQLCCCDQHVPRDVPG